MKYEHETLRQLRIFPCPQQLKLQGLIPKYTAKAVRRIHNLFTYLWGYLYLE